MNEAQAGFLVVITFLILFPTIIIIANYLGYVAQIAIIIILLLVIIGMLTQYYLRLGDDNDE